MATGFSLEFANISPRSSQDLVGLQFMMVHAMAPSQIGPKTKQNYSKDSNFKLFQNLSNRFSLNSAIVVPSLVHHLADMKKNVPKMKA